MLPFFTDGPEVSLSEKNTYMYLSYGGEITLMCDFVGVPLPSMVWLKNGVEFTAENSRTLISTADHDEGGASNLTIDNLEIEDGGVYSCRANSSRGVDGANVTVVVVCE